MPKGEDESKPGSQDPGGAPATPGTRPADQAAAQPSPKAAAAKPADANGSGTRAQTSAQPHDGIALLKADHRKVEGLFAEFESADPDRKRQIVRQACRDLIIHTLLEERLFYPAARQPDTKDKLDEAQVEHDVAKVLIVELLDGDDKDPYRDAKFKVLAEEIKQHVKEEEAADGVFAKAQKVGVNTSELAEQLTRLKQQLEQKTQSGNLPDPESASFQHFGEPTRQERNMPTDRDERGRFTSDDDYRSRSRNGDYEDDRRYQSRGSSGRERVAQGRFTSDDDDRDYRSSASTDRDRDSRGRFTSDDDDRRSYAARGEGGRGRSYRDDDDDRRYQARGRDDYYDERGGRGGGQRGWFGDPEGHSEASRRGWEHSDHPGSGWYGDSRGHAEASRRGWDDPDHGRSGWYGDSRGHAEASRRGWDSPDHGRSGWYGDPEGHSEASRRGWEERGGGRSYSASRSEGRSYASRDRDDDDDDRGGRRSGGRSHGGWSGDPEGHSEASRRGWEHRR